MSLNDDDARVSSLVTSYNRSARGQNLRFVDDVLHPWMGKCEMKFQPSFCSWMRNSPVALCGPYYKY